jgi:hypothetical protein
MKANWERIIREKMEPVELIPGMGSSIYKVKGDSTTVWVLTMPPPSGYEAPVGGRELSLDVADPDFLVVSRIVGMAEYTHYIAWEKIADIVFRFMS